MATQTSTAPTIPDSGMGALDSNKELSVSKEFYQNLLIDNFEDFAVFTVDHEWKVTSWSKAAQRMLGYEEKEILGKEISQFYTPEDVKNHLPEREIKEAIQSGKGLDEQEHLRKDGTSFWASVLVFPKKDDSGNIVGFTKIVRDISEFKKAEQKLQDALLYAHSIVETVRGPLVVLDGKLRIKTANKSFCRIFRVVPAETEGSLIYDIGNRQWDIPQLRKSLEDIIPRGSSFEDFVVDHTFESIGHKIMLLNARTILQGSDGTELILLAFEDITERKQAEAALEQEKNKLVEINERLKDINTMVSHDIRTPLRIITSFTDLLFSKHKSKMDREASDYLDHIRLAALRANNLVTDLLDLSRIERSKNVYSKVDVLEVIKSAVTFIGAGNQKKPVEIEIQQNIPLVHCDPVRIKEVFVNLIGNAIKYSSKQDQADPKIKIGYADRNSHHEFFVEDNGIGIAEEDQQKIFEIFKRLHSQDEYEGTGIGLHIVKRIILAHKGRLWVRSTVGKGSTFYFTIPKAQAEDSAPPA